MTTPTPTPPTPPEIDAFEKALNEYGLSMYEEGRFRGRDEGSDRKRRALLSSVSALAERAAKAEKEILDVHDALHASCDGKADLPAEIRSLRARLEAATARAAQAEERHRTFREEAEKERKAHHAEALETIAVWRERAERAEAELRACMSLRGAVMHLRDGGPYSTCSEGWVVCTNTEWRRMQDAESSERALRDGIRALAKEWTQTADWLRERGGDGVGGFARQLQAREHAAALRAMVDPVNAEKKEG